MNDLFEDRDRDLYVEALDALVDAGIPFMVGGAFAVYNYTGWWRNTHDIDVYITRDNLERTKQILADAGFRDLGEQAAGDREWIYHSGKNDLVFDVIWRFANFINYVEPEWFDRASTGEFLGLDLKFLPVEELIWVKVFVINRHRCDWPDIMRVIRAQCLRINWSRLLDLLGEHWLLLAGLIDVFDWQTPAAMDCIPDEIRSEIDRRRAEYRAHPIQVEREHLLDPWLHLRADRYEIRRNE